MNIKNGWLKVWTFYLEGFRQMTLGRVLWTIILVKLFIMFVVLKLFFFPNFVKSNAEDGQEAQFVADELLERF